MGHICVANNYLKICIANTTEFFFYVKKYWGQI